MGSTAFSDKFGVLFIQLGTPDAPTTSACRKFLREFLMDPDVIDIPFLNRWLLVNLIIAPFRAPKTAKAYQKIWQLEGGPLRFYSNAFVHEISRKVSPQVPVALGMRYGEPSIDKAWKTLKAQGVNRVLLFPLYPHYADSSFGTAIKEARRVLSKEVSVKIEEVPPFYADDFFIDAWREATSTVRWSDYDFVLFSYHGIPERHIRRTDPTKSHCFSAPNCCDRPVEANRLCYRHHCFESTGAMIKAFGLDPQKTATSFQSRLGRTPWIKPYTDLLLLEFPQREIKRLAVLSPSFVVDGLETLEEIQMRAREDFLKAGGERLDLIPSLNAHPQWVQKVVEKIKSLGAEKALSH